MEFFNLLHSLLKFLVTPFKSLFIKLISSLHSRDYDLIYVLLVTPLILLFFLHQFYKLNIFLVLILLLTILITLFHLLIFISIKKNYKLSTSYYRLLTKWAFFSFTFFLLISLSLGDSINGKIFSFTILLLGTLTLYFFIRFLLCKLVIHWFFYVLIFLFTPFLTAFAWISVGVIFMYPFFNYNMVLIGATIILSILFMNLIVFWIPFSQLDEVRVATYFLLGMFSTFSYLFFMADIATYFLRDFLIDFNQTSIPTETMRNDIDILIKWVTLPYLIGAVLCCFSIELVIRNYNKKNKAS